MRDPEISISVATDSELTITLLPGAVAIAVALEEAEYSVAPIAVEGPIGRTGASAFEIWLRSGHVGSENDFLGSLVGPPGRDAQLVTVIHIQSEPATTWLVQHNLGRYPSVTLVDTAKTVFEAQKSYLDENTIRIDLAYPSSGRVLLN